MAEQELRRVVIGDTNGPKDAAVSFFRVPVATDRRLERYRHHGVLKATRFPKELEAMGLNVTPHTCARDKFKHR